MNKQFLLNHKFHFFDFHFLQKSKFLLPLAFSFMFFSFSFSAKAQEEISINESEKTIKEVLRKIEKTSSYRFFYNSELTDLEKKVSISETNISVFSVLKTILQETNLTYKEMENKLILIAPKNSMNNRTINGNVKESGTENTLPGVKVMLKGTTQGTLTDFDGNFSLEVPSNETILVFSFIGYQNVEVSVGLQNNFSVEMKVEDEQLEEIVVIGYGTLKKDDLTGSVAAVDVAELKENPVADIGAAMQGKASGVQIITSGEPGSGTTFRIRGIGTIGNNNPLIVVDGMPLNGPLNQLNMNDIESLQILKDASSTAIYGARGANGVVIITTKRGKNGKTSLSLNTFAGFSEPTKMIEVLNAQDFAQLHNEMMLNGGLYTNPDFSNPKALGEGTDWLGEFFNPAFKHSTTLSYSGGTEKTNLYTSFNLYEEKGIILSTDYRRFIFQLNSDTKVTDYLKFGNSLKVNHDIKNSGSTSIQGALTSLPTQKVYDENGNFTGPEGEPLYSGDINNPIGLAKTVEQATKGYNFQGNVFTEVIFLENFSFKSVFGLEANFWNNRTWSPPYSWGVKEQVDAYLGQGSNQSITWLWDNTLSYNKEFENGFNLNAMMGTSAQANKFEYISGSIQNFPSNSTQTLNNGLEQIKLNGTGSEWAIFSYFTRVNLNFKNKYYATATVRRDGSSRFGQGNKFGTFPSASLAYRISEEEFFNFTFIESLKLRAGFGVTGNQEIGNYAFASSFNTYSYNFNGNLVSAVIPTVLPNTNVKWEAQEQFNIGLDADLFKSRISLILDAYIKNTTDMLVPQSVPVTSGYSDIYVPYVNAGQIQNKGIEVTITSYNVSKTNFSWNTDLIFSLNKNEVIDINSDVPMTSGSIGLNYTLSRIQNGYPINIFYGFVTDGIFQTQAEVENHAIQVPGTSPANSTSPGDIRFKDLNNDGIINDYDRTFLGTPNPDFIFSLNNTLKYKNWSLNIYLQGVYGNEIFNANRLFLESMNITSNQSVAVLERWTGEGTSNTMPRAVFGDPNNNTRASDRYIEDGSYLRLKNVSLNYEIPNSLLGGKIFKAANISLSGQNLLTLTNYSGFDPEVSSSGIDNSIYPISRTVSFSFNITF